jgi:hypothetical protein
MTYLTILGQVNLERFSIVFKTQRGHGEENVFPVYSLSLFLMALLGGLKLVSL